MYRSPPGPLLVLFVTISLTACASAPTASQVSEGKPGGTSVETRERVIADPATYSGFRYPYAMMMRW